MGRRDPPTPEELSAALQNLADQLAALPAEERELVIRAARGRVHALPLGRRGVPAAELRKSCGIVNLGGDAVEDCDALYDDA